MKESSWLRVKFFCCARTTACSVFTQPGSLADILRCGSDVRFTPKSGHWAKCQRPLWLKGPSGPFRGYQARLWDRRQVFGEDGRDAFIFSSIHLLTTSARLSRFSRAPVFSVRIQHSRAARVSGPSAAIGPVPLVWQAASVSAQAANSARRATERRTLKTTDFISSFQTLNFG